MTTYKEIKERFNHPRPAEERSDVDTPGEYCVGGAFCLHIGVDDPFPDEETLAKNLFLFFDMNSWQEARTYASGIIKANDDSLMDDAWDLLDALFNKYNPRR